MLRISFYSATLVDVQPLSSLISKLLTVYFVMLPFLFGVHASEHDHDSNKSFDTGLNITKAAVNCDLCDLYHSQTVFSHTSDFEVSHLFTDTSVYHFYTYHNESIRYSIYLRGPPNA